MRNSRRFCSGPADGCEMNLKIAEEKYPFPFRPQVRCVMPFKPLLAILLLSVFCAHAQVSSPAGIRVAPFKGDRVAAISYTFDDGLKDQADVAVPMLEQCGFRGTFFIVAGCVSETNAEAAAKKPGAFGAITWERLKEMSDRGHEIANHSWSHKHFLLTKDMNDETAHQEIDWADQRIKEKIGRLPLTFCFPGNGMNAHYEEMVLKDHIAIRQECKSFGGPVFTTGTANAWADELIAKGKWGSAMIHGILVGYSPFSDKEILREHLLYVKRNEDKIWVDTFANVSLYVQEKAKAELRLLSRSEREITFCLDCPLNRPPFLYPLTVVIPAKGATQAGAVLKNGTKIPVQITADKILFDCVPSPEVVTVRWQP